MTNKRKIDFLKNEIDRYKQQMSALQSENTELTVKIQKLNKKDYDRQELIDRMLTEVQTLKDEYNSCVKELQGYKGKYIKLLEHLASLKKHYKKEIGKMLGDVKRK